MNIETVVIVVLTAIAAIAATIAATLGVLSHLRRSVRFTAELFTLSLKPWRISLCVTNNTERTLYPTLYSGDVVLLPKTSSYCKEIRYNHDGSFEFHPGETIEVPLDLVELLEFVGYEFLKYVVLDNVTGKRHQLKLKESGAAFQKTLNVLYLRGFVEHVPQYKIRDKLEMERIILEVDRE